MSGVEAFELAGYAGEINERYLPADLQAQIARLVDPACSSETLHWGRNYLYSSRLETLEPGGRWAPSTSASAGSGTCRSKTWRLPRELLDLLGLLQPFLRLLAAPAHEASGTR